MTEKKIKAVSALSDLNKNVEKDREKALDAIRTLIDWIGDSSMREELLKTPERVLKSYIEVFSGYQQNPDEILQGTIKNLENHNDLILLDNIPFHSYCEHHMLPIQGKAHIGYIPDEKIIGISKFSRLIDCYAKRLQIQERLTYQIAEKLFEHIQPKALGVILEGEHACMSMRGVKVKGATFKTKCWLGDFKTDTALRKEFIDAIKSK